MTSVPNPAPLTRSSSAHTGFFRGTGLTEQETGGKRTQKTARGRSPNFYQTDKSGETIPRTAMGLIVSDPRSVFDTPVGSPQHKTSKVSELKGKIMKRYTWTLSVAALFTLALFAVYLRAQNRSVLITDSAAQINNPSGEIPAVVISSSPTRGVVFKTAAINSDGTVASCFRCNKTTTVKLSTGAYQVVFDEDVRASNGFSRWVQVDTLTTGSENAWCTTADRAGVTDGIYVQCQHEGGPGSGGNSAPFDTSFFIFVAR